jgi:ABC-type multidrug transport system ATPase subunit
MEGEVVTSPGEPLLELRGVAKHFRAGLPGCSAVVRVLSEASLSVRRGEVVALYGAPGSGKSTLLLCAAGMLRPDRGVVRLHGATLGGTWRGRAALVPATPVFRSFLTVADAITLYGAPCRGARPSTSALLQRLALWERRDARVTELGVAERRRLALACVLAGSPELLLVDAPVEAESDPLLLAALSSCANAGAGVLLAADATVMAAGLCARALRLERGRVLHAPFTALPWPGWIRRNADAAATTPICPPHPGWPFPGAGTGSAHPGPSAVPAAAMAGMVRVAEPHCSTGEA